MPTSTQLGDSIAPSVLWKAFEVLDAFSQGQRVLTLSEIARRSALPKSTVHRILTMLLQVEAVERVGPGFKIGIRMFSMGALSVDNRLREAAMPSLERLRRMTRQTVHLAVLQGTDVIYLEKLTSHLSPHTPALIGGRLPAVQTGVGKVLLAFGEGAGDLEPGPFPGDGALRPDGSAVALDDVRRRGYGIDRNEAARGLACVAMPVTVNGRAVAAVSVAFAAGDGSGEVFMNPLRETAGSLGRILATSPDYLR